MQRRLHDRVRYDVIGYTLVPRMAVGMGGYGEYVYFLGYGVVEFGFDGWVGFDYVV